MHARLACRRGDFNLRTRRWEEEDQIPCGEEDFIGNYDAALDAEDDEDDGSDGESDGEDT